MNNPCKSSPHLVASKEEDPLDRAVRLACVIEHLLNRVAASSESVERSEARYAEALARTLYDQITTLRSLRESHHSGSEVESAS